jgi:hypothetical protein
VVLVQVMLVLWDFYMLIDGVKANGGGLRQSLLTDPQHQDVFVNLVLIPIVKK